MKTIEPPQEQAAQPGGLPAAYGYVTAPRAREYSCGWCNGTGMVETDESWECAMCEGKGIRIIASRSHTIKEQATGDTGK